jgi:S-DNA-T family DNA segregation ATPase FtsK/SpoIIIE
LALKDNPVKKNTLKQEHSTSQKAPRKSSGQGDKKVGLFRDEKVHQMAGVTILVFTAFLLLAFISYLVSWNLDDSAGNLSFKRIAFDNQVPVHNWTGRLGAALAHQFIKEWFGIASFLFILVFLVIGIWLFLKKSILHIGKTTVSSIMGILWLSVAIGFLADPKQDIYTVLAGSFGYWSNEWLGGMIGNPGIILVLILVLVGFLIFALNVGFRRHRPMDEEFHPDLTEQAKPINILTAQPDDQETQGKPLEKKSYEFDDEGLDKKTGAVQPVVPLEVEQNRSETEETNGDKKDQPEHYTVDTFFDPTLELRDYKFPPLDLLNEIKETASGVNKEELETNKNKIVETLNNYMISIDKIKATIGPAVTLYEIIPSPGVRIAKIKNLEDDIALSLSALGIRIIAPLPGKGTIGIEVPNKNPEIVSIRSILSSEKFQNNKLALPFGIGKTISNESYIADLTKMPHILMAGATGQGKSVGLNAIIASLLYKKHPSQLKFILVDPKKVELTLFSKIERHFLAKLPDVEDAIITNNRQVVRTLHSLNIEMDSRYDLLKDAQVRNIQEYNAKFVTRKLNPNDGHRYLPYLVLVVDEFADLILTAGKEIETPLTRLAQLSRAIGIHLILATQRPSVNIITGTIKANFPARIAYRVISKIDSRTILDSSGADQLIGRGDMLLSTGNDLVRLQCAFVDIDEVERVTDFIGSQRGYPDAFYLPEYLDEEDEANKDFDPSQRDELFEDAARIVVQHQHGSTSLLQRKLKLGYNRAGRIIDQLEAAGVVGPFEGSKAREVKIKNELVLEQLLRDLRDNL